MTAARTCAALRVVGDGPPPGPARTRCAPCQSPACREKPSTIAERVLQRVPARDLGHVALVRAERPLLHDRGGPLGAPRPAVLMEELGRRAVRCRDTDAGDARVSPPPRRLPSAWFFGGEGVDRRRDDVDARAIQLRPDEALAGEHPGVGGLDVGPQEGDRLVDDCARLVGADVQPPDDPDARVAQRGRHPRRLRVVEDDRVVAARLLEQRRRAGARDLLVVPPLRGAERPAVALRAVQVVVEPLREGEELRVARQHEPAGVDARAARVREQRAEHLGDAAAGRGRVDAPDRPVPERVPRALLRHLPLAERRRVEHLTEALGVEGRDLDGCEHGMHDARSRPAPNIGAP